MLRRELTHNCDSGDGDAPEWGSVANEEHFRKLERMYLAAPVNAYYAPRLEVGEGRCNLEIDIQEKFYHAAHAVHGSVYFKALDDAGWFAAASLLEDNCILTASFNIYLLRPASEGTIRATGRVVHQTLRVFIAEAELTDSDGRLLARGSGSFMRTQIALSPDIGYA